MATKHGNKVYIQLLLDPARALLLEQIAEDKGIKVSALARQAIYDWVLRQLNDSPATAALEAGLTVKKGRGEY